MIVQEKNKEALLATAPYLWETIKNYKPDENHVSAYVAKDGSLYQIYHGVQDIRLNSSYSPINEAVCWGLAYQSPEENAVFFVHGFGNGMMIRELLKQGKEKRKILVYESSLEIFLNTLVNYDVSDLLTNHNLHLVINGINEMELCNEMIRLLSDVEKCNAMLIQLPEYGSICSDGIDRLERLWNEASYLVQVNKNTMKRFSNSLYKNQLYHFSYLKGQFVLQDLKEVWPEKMPMIIVGAGPSLDKNINILKEMKGHVPILCMDSALSTLKKHDLRPDFYMAIESAKPLQLFDKDWLKGIPFLGSLVCPSELIDESYYEGKKIFCSFTPFIEKIFEKVEIPPVRYTGGGNVGTTAFLTAYEVGAKPIILVGHDHAYSESGAAHTEGRNQELKEAFIENEEDKVEGFNGGLVQSRYDWKIYLNWYADSIPKLKDIEVINATEGGARIAHTKEMTLREVAKKYENNCFDVNELLSKMTSRFDDTMMEKIYAVEEDIQNQIKQISVLSRKGMDIALELIRELDKTNEVTTKSVRLSEELSGINKAMITKDIYELLDECREARETSKPEYKYHSEDEEIEGYLTMYQDILHCYEGLCDAIKFLRKAE